MSGFIIYALPRSRTWWLSRFLSYGDWHCGHDEARHFRSMDDVRSWLSQPCTGSVETMAAPFWRLAKDVRAVVVRRPAAEVIESLTRLGFDPVLMARLVARLDHKLDQIERRTPNVLSVSFDDLADEAVCAKVFEFCLPYRHDRNWWAAMAAVNLQTSMPALTRYAFAHRQQIEKMAKIAKHHAIAAMRPDVERPDGVTIQEEPYETVWRDAKTLFAQHSVDAGEAPDYHFGLNSDQFEALAQAGAWQIVTARANGRMFGYVSAIIGPSLERKDLITATQLGMFVSPDARGMNLPMRLQRYAVEAYRRRGVGKAIFRAGTNGSGPAMGAVYRRVGATSLGEYYEMSLAA